MRYVGVARRKGARPLAGRRGQRAGKVTARALTPGVSGGTLLASCAMNLWRLDAHRMAAAVAHFAPGVRVIDQDTGQVRGPAGLTRPQRPPVITHRELSPGHRAAYARRRFSGADRSRAERMDLRASDKPRGATARPRRVGRDTRSDRGGELA
jgi:hypothetical protein